MTVPYIKILPLTLESGSSMTILLQVLDREDKTKLWEPEIRNISQSPSGSTQITLPVSWENFLLLSNMRMGLSGLSSTDLRKAAENLRDCGYLPQVFEAELLERFARPLFLLPFGIFALGFGWQYRALKRPRYMGYPMLGILPLIFNGISHFSRNWFNELGILAVVSLGFTTSAIVFAIGTVLLLVISFILLASKRG
jgi:lipopolysaccharide export LptBFGC system permease protein LptF